MRLAAGADNHSARLFEVPGIAARIAHSGI
jgi:hypothetical protein